MTELLAALARGQRRRRVAIEGIAACELAAIGAAWFSGGVT